MWCPLSKNCTISKATSASKTSPNAGECAELAKEDLSMLGSDPNYGCYFEWVFMNLGENAYMHRPLSWSFLEFVSTKRKNKCGNVRGVCGELIKITPRSLMFSPESVNSIITAKRSTMHTQTPALSNNRYNFPCDIFFEYYTRQRENTLHQKVPSPRTCPS